MIALEFKHHYHITNIGLQTTKTFDIMGNNFDVVNNFDRWTKLRHNMLHFL